MNNFLMQVRDKDLKSKYLEWVMERHGNSFTFPETLP